MADTNSRKLPPERTPEWDECVRVYLHGSNEEVAEKAREYHFANPSSFKSTMRYHGITGRENQVSGEVVKPIKASQKFRLQTATEYLEELIGRATLAMPPLKVVPVDVKVGEGRQREEQVLLLSDLQVGVKTKSYDAKVFRRRLKTLQKAIIRIKILHSKNGPVPVLHIFALGDFPHNEVPGGFVDIAEIEQVLIEQIYETLTPAIYDFLGGLLPYYDEIWWHGIRGNHGASGLKYSHSITSNWDTVFYKQLEAVFGNEKNIKFDIEWRSFYHIVEVNGHNFFLTHGDIFPIYFQVPYYSVTRKAAFFKGAIPEDFDAMCYGHFHQIGNIEFNGVEAYGNGTFESGDEWSLSKMALNSSVKQWTFGVHKKRGITWQYKLQLDEPISKS